MIITVFRSRLRSESADEYAVWADRMSELVKAVPGYVSHKVFVAEDGERVTLVEFESAEAQRAWSTHPEHSQAKRKGRESFYAEYRLQVCKVIRDADFVAD